MRERGVFVLLGVIAAVAVGGFVAVLLTQSGTGRDGLWNEAGKAALQVLTVAVLGAVLKQLADGYKAERERAAQGQRFRQDKYDRLVEATNALRPVPIYVQADRSLETWDAQMHEVVAAGLKLRTIKHQIWSSKGVEDPPFEDVRELTYLFESLYRYTDWVIDDYVARN